MDKPRSVMPYLTSGSLADRIKKEGRITWSEAVRITGQIAEALDYAHQQGVVHRDVKPSNILFDDDGEAFLTDFGIAHDADASTLTAVGTQPGTYHYMAPEQVRGDEVDGKADQFALATVFYQMVSGRLPFSATDTAALTYQIVHEATAKLPSNVEIPYGASSVLERAHYKYPKRRYPSVGNMAAALQELSFTAAPVRKRRPLLLLTRKQRQRLLYGIVALMILAACSQGLAAHTGSSRKSKSSPTPPAITVMATSSTSTPSPGVTVAPISTTRIREHLRHRRKTNHYGYTKSCHNNKDFHPDPSANLYCCTSPHALPTGNDPAADQPKRIAHLANTCPGSEKTPTSPDEGYSTTNFIEFKWFHQFPLFENEAFELVLWPDNGTRDRGKSPIQATTGTSAQVNLQNWSDIKPGKWYWGVYLFDKTDGKRLDYLGGGRSFVYQPSGPPPTSTPGINE